MELATVTSKGQITIPVKIRNKLSLKTGDQVFFMEEKGKIVFQNASQIALSSIQNQMKGKADKAGFKSEKDVIDYIKELRAKK
jgi:antitoxin PrlF